MKKIIIGISIVFVVFISVIYIYNINYNNKILEIKNCKSPDEIINTEVYSLQMTEEDYIEDFDYLWKVISEAMPVIENYKSEWNYDYLSNYDKYKHEIELVKDDFDFLCKIKSFLNDIPSFHTYFMPENFDNVFYSSCYLSDSILLDKKLKSLLNLWNEKCQNNIEKYLESSNSIVFCYVDGEYVFSSFFSTCDNFNNYKLYKIDGNNSQEYILNTLSSYKLKYDYKNSEFFRPYIIFNDNFGEKHDISLVDDSGNIINTELFFDLRFEYSKCFYDLYLGNDNNSKGYCLDSIDDKTLYCQIDNFSGDTGMPLYEELKDLRTSQYIRIVVDIRNNTGGYIESAITGIFPFICSEEVNITDNSWIYKSFAVKELYSLTSLYSVINRKLYGFKECEKPELYTNYQNRFLRREISYKFSGYSSCFQDVYILTSKNTGSAADFFVAAMNKCSSVTIIGENTGGEKYGGQALDVLPNSKLVFSFFPEIYYNEDGKNNSLYGTFPDEYATISLNDFKLREAMLMNGKDPYSMENRMIWDTALKRTLDIIKEKQQ